jgi:hypothetical protein
VAATTAAPTTVAATSTTTNAATTTSATTGSSKITPISGAPKAPVAKAPLFTDTPAAKATVPPAVSANDSDPFLALLGKVGAASLNAKSAKLSMTVNATSSGSVTQLNAAAILTETNDIDMVVSSGGQQVGLVILAGKVFLNTGGAWSQVTDQSQLTPFKFVFDTVSYIIPNDTELKKFAGSSFQVYPNEKLDDGTPVGYIVIDTSSATDSGVKELGTVVYVYDPKTYLISAFYSTSPTLEIGMAIGNYNDPSNVVQNPLTGTTLSSGTPAATTTTAAASGDSGSGVGLYPGATTLNLPDALTKQFETSVGSAVKNPQAAAFTTSDSYDKVKTYYVDLLQKNGWSDISAQAGAGLSQLESAGGFGLVYLKGSQVVVLIGLPASSASALGISDAPSSGTMVLGFSGQA